MSVFTGKKYFTIHVNDAGQEAYDDKYVKWLEEQVQAITDELWNERTCSGQVICDMKRDIRELSAKAYNTG